MACAIVGEFDTILRACIRETVNAVRATGTTPTPNGPRVQFDVTAAPIGMNMPPDDVRDVAEAASRYLAVRWLNSKEPRPVPEHSRALLIAQFPRIYDAPLETRNGWHWMLVMTAEWISEGGLPKNYVTKQVKEKLGGLRLYHDGTPATMRIVRAVGRLSYGICETCGAPGHLRRGSWHQTACDVHARHSD